MSCTCHICPPCGYCVEGTETYREALGFAEMLDDRELERLHNDISNMVDERGAKLAQKHQQPAAVVPVAVPLAGPAIEQTATAKGPDAETSVAQIKTNVSSVFKRAKLAGAFAAALKAPYNRGPWDGLDAADRIMWENSVLGPKGSGAGWDNRRKVRA
jgi:hypothetical protein